MTFPAGSTVEQRFPGATEELARSGARARIASFEALGWDVREQRWLPDAVAGAGQGVPAGAPDATASGTLAVVFEERRDTETPGALSAGPSGPPERRGPSAFTLRVIAGFVVFGVLLLLIMVFGMPIVGTLVAGGSPRPLIGS